MRRTHLKAHEPTGTQSAKASSPSSSHPVELRLDSAAMTRACAPLPRQPPAIGDVVSRITPLMARSRPTQTDPSTRRGDLVGIALFEGCLDAIFGWRITKLVEQESGTFLESTMFFSAAAAPPRLRARHRRQRPERTGVAEAVDIQAQRALAGVSLTHAPGRPTRRRPYDYLLDQHGHGARRSALASSTALQRYAKLPIAPVDNGTPTPP